LILRGSGGEFIETPEMNRILVDESSIGGTFDSKVTEETVSAAEEETFFDDV
jgi:hypothetical protein